MNDNFCTRDVLKIRKTVFFQHLVTKPSFACLTLGCTVEIIINKIFYTFIWFSHSRNYSNGFDQNFCVVQVSWIWFARKICSKEDPYQINFTYMFWFVYYMSYFSVHDSRGCNTKHYGIHNTMMWQLVFWLVLHVKL